MPRLAAAQAGPAATPTPAQEAPNRAREAFQKANVHYALGEFGLAAELYQDAYKLKPDAALLYNAAQSFRLAGNAPRALVLYKNYLLFYPAQRNAPEVKQQVINLQNAIATAEKAQTAPPTSTAQPHDPDPARPVAPARTDANLVAPAVVTAVPSPSTQPQQVPTPGVITTPAPSAALAVSAPLPRADHAPVYKKWWFWVATVGAVVVVAGAVTAGVVVSRRANNGATWATTGSFGSGAKALNISSVGVSF